MIKFRFGGREGDVPCLGIGLSAENIKRLGAGKPILIQEDFLKKSMGWEGSIIIMHGQTENHILNQLKPFVGEGTKVMGDVPEDLGKEKEA